MCPHHLKPSLPPGSTGGSWPSSRPPYASKHRVWRPQPPKQQRHQMDQQQQQQQQNDKHKNAALGDTALPSMEPETIGPLDFGPPADLCLNEVSLPPQLLQQQTAPGETPAAAVAPGPLQQMTQLQFCLFSALPEEENSQESKAGENDALWPPLAGIPRNGRKQQKNAAKHQQQQQQQKRKSVPEDEEAAQLASPALCKAPPSSPASVAAADLDSIPIHPTAAAATRAAAGVRAPPGLSGPDVQSALLRASFLGRTDIVRLCLERGASPAAADEIGRTPLHYAAATGVAEAVALLLKFAANGRQQGDTFAAATDIVDLADRKRWTPLLIAVTKEHVPCVRLLLAAGANAQHLLCHRCAPCRGSSNNGAGAAAAAAAAVQEEAAAAAAGDAAGKEECAAEKQGMQHSSNGGVETLQTWSAAIHFAAIKGNIQISELLLQHGSTVNDLDSDGRPPLHYAACRDKPQYVNWLLQQGGRPDVLDCNKRTVFHAAATRGNLQVVQLLLEATPPKTLLRLLLQQDVWALTAEALAKLHGHRPMHLLLKSYREAVSSQVSLEEAAAAATSRAVGGSQGLSDSAVSATIAEVLATGLQELKKAKLVRAVQRLGTLPCLKAYQQTLMIQALGGMLVADGSRRKTAGGVFFTILNEFAKEGQISRDDLAFVNAEDCETRKAVKRRVRQGAEGVARPLALPDAAAAALKTLQVQECQQKQKAETNNPRQQQQTSNAPRPQQERQQQTHRQQQQRRKQQHVVLQLEEGTSSAASTPSACSYTSLVAAIAGEAAPGLSVANSPSSNSSIAAPAAAAHQPPFGYPVFPLNPYWPVGFPGPLSPPPSVYKQSSSNWNLAAAAAQQQQQLAAAVAASSAMNFATSSFSLQQAVAAVAAHQQHQQQQLQHAAFTAAVLPPPPNQQQRKRQPAANPTKPRRSQPRRNFVDPEESAAAAHAEAPQQQPAKAPRNGRSQQQPQPPDTQELLERIHQQQLQLQQQQMQLEQLQQQQRQAAAAAKKGRQTCERPLAPNKGKRMPRAPRS